MRSPSTVIIEKDFGVSSSSHSPEPVIRYRSEPGRRADKLPPLASASACETHRRPIWMSSFTSSFSLAVSFVVIFDSRVSKNFWHSTHPQDRKLKPALMKIRARLNDGAALVVIVNLAQVDVEHVGVSLAPADLWAAGRADFSHSHLRHDARPLHQRRQRPFDVFRLQI